MKRLFNNKSSKVVLLLASVVLVVMAVPLMVHAQSAPLPYTPTQPTPTSPIGGLEFLALAGGAYAVKKLRDKKK